MRKNIANFHFVALNKYSLKGDFLGSFFFKDVGVLILVAKKSPLKCARENAD